MMVILREEWKQVAEHTLVRIHHHMHQAFCWAIRHAQDWTFVVWLYVCMNKVLHNEDIWV